MSKFLEKIFKDAKVEGAYFLDLSENGKKETKRDFSDYQKGLDEGRKQGYEAGRSEGLEEGFRNGLESSQTQLKDTLNMLNLISASFQLKKEELFEEIKPEIIKFNLHLMEKLLRQQLENPILFTHLLEKLLQQVGSIMKNVPVHLCVSVEDAQMLKNHLQTDGLLSEILPLVNLVEDSLVERGNCRLETPLGLLNYDIKRLLKDLEIKVLQV